MHEENSFITLTYNDQHVPPNGSLNVQHFQLFMKRLRKQISPKKIRYYHCGEYGENFSRPHYHALIFGHEFADKEYFKSINEQKLFISESLSRAWQYQGFCSIGSVTYESAAYVARYIMKKQTGVNANDHYLVRPEDHEQTGEIYPVAPEYTTMSRRPGIGATWYEKFGSTDAHSEDFIPLANGKKTRVPKFYDSMLDRIDPIEFEKIRQKRIKTALYWAENNTPERLKVREQIQERKLEMLPRNL